MTVARLFAIIMIFITALVAWLFLGAVSTQRSSLSSDALNFEVHSLWGNYMVQQSPVFFVKVPGSERKRKFMPDANRIEAKIDLDHRRKGLIWYSTYTVDFSAEYEVSNTDPVAQNLHVYFSFPSQEATYDRFGVWVDGASRDVRVDTREGIHEIIALAPGEAKRLRVSYRTRGTGMWRYRLAGEYGRVRNLFMQVATNFRDIDFAEGSLSPMGKEVLEEGMLLTWKAEDLITTQDVGLVMPEKLNPGPLSARMSFFAPVCLLFFFVLITALGIVRKVEVHPMHYLFVAAGFFAFHLLFAYLIDLINIHLAFVIASGVSMGLVSLYLASALGPRFPWRWALAGQVLYLILFSYSFFLKGMTGLTVTLGAIVTLAVIMRLTAKTNWSEVFAAKGSARASQA